MKNVEAPDLSIVYTSLIFRHKNASISNPIPERKPGSRTVPLRGAATNLRAIHLSIVYAFRYFVAKRWKIWKQQTSALYMLFQLLATTSRAADLTSLYGSFISSPKNVPKKAPKIKEVYTDSHTGCRQECVPEGTKSQICIRIIYFLPSFWAMTPPPPSPTRRPCLDLYALRRRIMREH